MVTGKSFYRMFSVSLVVMALLTSTLPVQAESLASPLFTSSNFLWAKSMGGTGGDTGYSVTVDLNGNVYTTGQFSGTVDFDPGAGVSNLISNAGSNDIFVSKMDGSGNFTWAKSIGGTGDDAGRSIAVDTNGNVYTTGYFAGTADFDPGVGTTNLISAGLSDIFISKLDGSGIFVWAKSMGSTDYDGGEGIALDASANVYTTGSFYGTVDFDPGAGTVDLTSAGGKDIFVSKLSSSGNYVWARDMGGTGDNDQGSGIAIDIFSNVYTTGSFSGTADFDPGAGVSNLTGAGNKDIFVSKLNINGIFAWARGMGGTNNDIGNDIAVDSFGNVHTTGYFSGTADFDPGAATANLIAAGGFDIFVSKLDTGGNYLWAKRIGGLNDEIGFGINLDSDGSVYTTGYFAGRADFDPGDAIVNLDTAGFLDIFISRLDNNGNYTWATGIGGTGNENGYSIDIDSIGNIFTTGYFQGTVDFDPGAGTSNLISGGNNDIFVSKLGNGGGDTVGVFRPSNGALYLKNTNTTGFADYVLTYGLPGDYPVVGDWDGNGTSTLGVYRNGNFYLRNSNTNGFADMVIAFGAAGDQPVAGDWDGNGTDTIGLYRSSIGTFFLRNTNTSGAPDISFSLGVSGDVGIAGDWNGDGTDTTGVFRPTNGALYLKNANTTGFADIVLTYGLPGDKPVTGDWNSDGIDTIGVYRNGGFYLRNSNTNGFADINLALGINGDIPIAGDWDGLP